MKSIYLFFVPEPFGVIAKKPLPNPKSLRFTLQFFVFIILALLLESMILFQLIF